MADENNPDKVVGTRDGNAQSRREFEEASVSNATRLTARLIYEVIRRDGEEELERPTLSLIWSGVAAGVLISLSVLAEAVLRDNLPPDQSWSYLVENLGYSLGFLVVILGRMQLFTENTISTVLPTMSRQSLRCLYRMLRLWAVVLTANIAGAFLAAGYMSLSGLFDSDMQQVLSDLSHHAVGMGAWPSFIRAIPAGVLVAGIVWMMPSAQGNAFMVILTFTWLIAAGDFTHIIAGSVEMAYLIWQSQLGIVPAMLEFFLPVLAGNIIGGTAIFALLAWGQVKNEVAHGGSANQ